MPAASEDWHHFTPRQPKRRRAENVCIFCHSKKIKCDLQNKTDRGAVTCSNCATHGLDCRLRKSRRGKQRTNDGGHDDDCALPAPSDSTMMPTSPHEDFAILTFDGLDQSLQIPEYQQPQATMAISPTQKIHPETEQRPSRDLSIAQSAGTNTSPREVVSHSHSGDVDTGFIHVYGPENQLDAEQQERDAISEPRCQVLDPRQQELFQSFAETYWQYCYPWCPVLDRETLIEEMANSPLLANAVALAGSHIQPPLVRYEGTASYYNKAKAIFYGDEESDNLTNLKALCLFYWWAPRPPSTAQRNSSWWWNSVIIRTAQQMTMHREPPESSPLRDRLRLNLRRRIWWTVFARERLTALCQSKPCIIDPDDCNVAELQLSDFPSDSVSQKQGLIFIHWVRLCAIIGEVAKYLSRASQSSGAPFPHHLHLKLVSWIKALPEQLQLPIGSARTEIYDRDVHQLHLPYLTTIIILHLKRNAHDLPEALPPAILAASCIARILRDILTRGNARFLMPITCWYSGSAFTALLQARRVPKIGKEVEDDLDVLESAISQLETMWATAKIIRQGFERLRNTHSPDVTRELTSSQLFHPSTASDPSASWNARSTSGQIEQCPRDIEWTALFPFVTRSTNGIADALLSDIPQEISRAPSPTDFSFHESLLNHYQNLLEPFGAYPLDFPESNFSLM